MLRFEWDPAKARRIAMAGGGGVLLLVAHTLRMDYEGEVIRLISARRATRQERMRYEDTRD